MKRPKEGDIVRACLDYLKRIGVMAWRNNTGRMPWTDKAGNSRSFAFGAKGSPDIMAVLPGSGRFLGVECKAPGNKQSPDQMAWQVACEAQGGRYVVARSLDDLMGVFLGEQSAR